MGRPQPDRNATVAAGVDVLVRMAEVKAVTEALCGHAFSASAISRINAQLDDSLRAFAERR